MMHFRNRLLWFFLLALLTVELPMGVHGQAARSSAEGDLQQGVAKLVAGDAAGAVPLLERHVRALPNDFEGRYYLAQAYHKVGRDADAVKVIRRAHEIDPSNASVTQKYGELLCSSGDSVAGLQMLERARGQDPTLQRLAFDMAVALYQNRKLDDAFVWADKAVHASPRDHEAVVLLGTVLAKLGRWAEAKPALEQALALRPDDASLLVVLGQCDVELKQAGEAEETLQRAIAIDPLLPQAHFLLSRAYAAEGHKEEARLEAELHQKLVQEISFDLPDKEREEQAAESEKVKSLLLTGNQSGALALLRAGGKSEAVSMVGIGAEYLKMGREAEATSCFHEALKLDASVRGAHIYLGIAALQDEDLPTAEHEFETELKMDPNQPVALVEMGEVRYRQSRWAACTAFITQSKTASPRFLFMMADAQFHQGDVHGANVTAEAMAAHASGDAVGMKQLLDLLQRNGQTELAARLSK